MKTSAKKTKAQAALANHDLCCGCGVCAAICPASCIEMRFDQDLEYKPFIKEGACTNCALCSRVCPENKETTVRAEQAFKETHSSTTENHLLGPFTNCYVGYVTKTEDRRASASGGLLTAVLEELLAKNLVDDVVVVGPSRFKFTGKFFEPLIANAVDGVRDNRGSKYYPVEYSHILKKIDSAKSRQYAVVTLPCATLAIRKAQLNGKLTNIRYVFSLACGHGVSAVYTEYLLKSYKIDPRSVLRISYRDKTGIPTANDSNLTIEYQVAEKTRVLRLGFLSSYIGRIWCNRLFTPVKCFFCTDFAGEISDASFSDAWLPEYIQDVRGTSMVIVRDQKIDSLICDLTKTHKINALPISPEKIIKAQSDALQFKKELIKGRIRLYKLLYQDFPDYGLDFQHTSLLRAIRSNWKAILNQRFSKWLYHKKLLNLIDVLLIRM